MTPRSIYQGDYTLPEIEKEPVPPYFYRYFLVELRTDILIAEVPFIGVTWGAKISGAGEFSGTIPVLDTFVPGLDLYSATMPGKVAIYVMRGSKAVFGGIIWARSYNAAARTLSVSGASFESYLFRRVIWHDLTYSNEVDQYDVVRDLLGRMQNDFDDLPTEGYNIESRPGAADIGLEVEEGFGSGFYQDTQNWKGGELRTFGDAIAEFADNINGFEWNIQITWEASLGRFRKLFTFSPAWFWSDTGDALNADKNIWEFPGNILDISLDESSDTASTRYIVAGGGGSEDFKPNGSWVNSGYLAAHWPLLDVVESSKHSNASVINTLANYARQYGHRTRPPVATWNIVVNGNAPPTVGQFALGEACRILVHDEFLRSRMGFFEEDMSPAVMRIVAYTVAVPDVPQRPETVTLDLSDKWSEPGGGDT